MSGFEDKAQGKADQVAGKIKEMAGETFNDEQLAAEGRGQQAGGKLHEAVGELKEAGEKVKRLIRDDRG